MATWDSTYDRQISVQRRPSDPPEVDDEEMRSNIGAQSCDEDETEVRIPRGRPRLDSEGEHSDMSAWTKRTFSGMKMVIGVLLFFLVLSCIVLSKITLVSLTDQLRNATKGGNPDKAVTLYWHLLLVITIPNAVSFVRSFLYGVFGKTRENFPWPKAGTLIKGAFASLFEVLAMTVLVYIVLPSLLPDVSILLLNGVFTFQILIDIYQTKKWCCLPSENRAGYQRVEQDERGDQQEDNIPIENKSCFVGLLENRTTKTLALILQVSGIVLLAVFSGYQYSTNKFNPDSNLSVVLAASISIPLALGILSCIWSNRVQESILKGPSEQSARFKSCFVNSGIKLVLYPFVSYVVMRYANPHTPPTFDPWCVKTDCTISMIGDSLPELITQVVASFLGYSLAWIACTMTLGASAVALPLVFSTPLAFAWYSIHIYVRSYTEFQFPKFHSDQLSFSSIIGAGLYISELLAMALYMFSVQNVILAKDSDMFIAPHYDGVFLEQQIILNRQVRKHKQSLNQTLPHDHHQRVVFICTPMYHENEAEMNSLLFSFKRVAAHMYRKALRKRSCENVEFHIFFDKGVIGHQFQPYALQFLSLLKGSLGIDVASCKKVQTSYGYQLYWDSASAMPTDGTEMPFVIHLKDEFEVKSGKRWSQVMYMQYILKHRMKQRGLDVEKSDCFILTTDADTSFTTDSVLVLLDLLISNSKVGAVCTRIHPTGSGPLYWYQIFDYAVGHWLMKPAEHILGSVLCCPGCFSVFRCKALNSVLEDYSTEVETAPEFLIKNMGEDRWLSTLLIKKGWRLEYCAASQCITHCPVTFEEFFKQRRRWIASTLANLVLLISKCCTITQKSDTVSFLFILYQVLLLFATFVSPATVILIIASGFEAVRHYDTTTTTYSDDNGRLVLITLLVIAGSVYGIICVYASHKTQIDVAKVLTFFFAIAMTVVVVGLITEVVSNIFDRHETEIQLTLDQFDAENPTNITAHVFYIPVSISTIYLGLLAVLFTTCAVFHLTEVSALLHCFWYILALPSGYFFLIIYAAANLDSQSWGTREQTKEEDKGLLGWFEYVKANIIACFLWCFKRRVDHKEDLEMKPLVVEMEKDEDEPRRKSSTAAEQPMKRLDEESLEWLESHKSEHYQELFCQHGYTDLFFIASMNRDDFEAIGVDKRGYVLRLEQAAKKLPKMTINTQIPVCYRCMQGGLVCILEELFISFMFQGNVKTWLTGLRLEEYADLLKDEGYETREDIANLKELTEDQLHKLKITKRAHVKRLLAALHSVNYPKEIDWNKREALKQIDRQELVNNSEIELARWTDELNFWTETLDDGLRPQPPSFTPVRSLQIELRSLRNSMLALLLLINLMWIILIFTLHTKPLLKYGLDQRAVQLLFLAVYGIIIVVQFLCMLAHRAASFVHYAGRFNREDFLSPDSPRDDFDNVSSEDFAIN